MLFESLRAEQRTRRLRVEETLEDEAGFLLVGETIDFAGDHVVGNSSGELNGSQLVGQVRLVGCGQCANQGLEIGVFFRGRRIADWRSKYLADTSPVLIEIIRPRPESPGAAANQPAEDEATADVQEAPAPTLGRA